MFTVLLPRVGNAAVVAARELGQEVCTAIFTCPEVAVTAAGLPLEIVASDYRKLETA